MRINIMGMITMIILGMGMGTITTIMTITIIMIMITMIRAAEVRATERQHFGTQPRLGL
jgi:hypothetical protein